MTAKTVFPCPEWAERLAAMHPEDLSQSDYVALQQHLRQCSACATVYTQYQMLGSLVRELPASDPPSEIPPRLVSILDTHNLVGKAVVSTPDNEARSRRSSRPLMPSFSVKRRVWLALLAAVLILGLLGGIFFLHTQNRSGVTVNAAIEIAPLPVLSQSTLYVSNGTLHAFRSDTGALIKNYSGVVPTFVGTPAIANGVIYTGTQSAVYALRLSDGAVLWHASVGNRTLLPPTVVDGVVYVLPNDTTLDALRASDGKLLWQYSTGNGDQPTLPIVVNKIAYIGASNPSHAYVEALNTANGALLWRQRVGTTYVGLSMENDVLYAASDTFLTALRSSNGKVLWQQRMSGRLGPLTAVGGMVYVITDDGYLYAKRGSDGSTLWKYKTGEQATSVTAPVVAGGIVYIAILSYSPAVNSEASYGYVYAFRASNGHLIWHYQLGENVTPELTVGQGKVFVMSRDGLLYAFQASTGSVLWKIKVS